MRMLDLFCGRFGWGRAFAARGWEVVGVDLVEPPEIPRGCHFLKSDVEDVGWIRRVNGIALFDGIDWRDLGLAFDLICASSPCEQFSVHGMACFHKNPPYPEMGIQLFNYTRTMCEASGLPYVMENVRPAQKFVGNAVNHCGPFYLWGTGVPPIMPQGIRKGISTQRERNAEGKRIYLGADGMTSKQRAREAAVIPPELANCVADYAERLLEMRAIA